MLSTIVAKELGKSKLQLGVKKPKEKSVLGQTRNMEAQDSVVYSGKYKNSI
jgi:hypothetical protein